MIYSLTNRESVTIYYLRVMSMASIVICHFLQAMSNHWAWVFNIGVQIFLLISGFLYGHKHVDKWRQWYWKRFVRVYVPFILFIIAVIPIYTVAQGVTIKNIVVYFFDLQGLIRGWGVDGLGHLWFLTAIALCYATTPILQWLSRHGIWIMGGVIIGAAVVFLKYPQYGSRSSWFVLYALGYYLAQIGKYEKLIIGVLAVGVLCSLFPSFSWEKMMHSSCAYCVSFHIAAAVTLFLSVLLTVSSLTNPSAPGCIRFIDKYSFQIYIVHHILIMPPFGFLHVTDYIVLDIFIILMYMVFYTWILSTMEVKVNNNLLSKVTKKIR